MTLLSAALLAAAATPAARADVDLDLRAGIYTDGSDGFLGGGILWDVGQRGHWMANPNLEYVFVNNGDLFTLNGDVHYDLQVDAPFAVWAGGGPALLFADPDEGDSETDFGLNLLAGIGAKEGGIRPFAQVKLIVSDESQLVFGFGLRF
ncbi:MAG TPA: hypothetical protein VFV75_03715 [Candidatus Polarisedimenticolaceae bacterium]|nr:hypothetical protein [Candidatus Polarisedimenticolaceae bacterium]